MGGDAAHVTYERALVTGGGGFLGRALVERLLERGVAVTTLARGDYPELRVLGVRALRGDVADARDVRGAVEGQDVVFHVAAKAGVWGPDEEYERANVVGTRHVLDAVLDAGVPRLVHTSSPSVVFDGHDHRHAGQDLPYPRRFLAAYPRTKAAAEVLVLRADGAPLAGHGERTLATVALRPHLVFGPRDPHLVPRLLERAARRQLAIVGDGTNEVSLTYVDNAAAAHLAAADALAVSSSPARGKAYFVANREPVRLWAWIGELLREAGLPPVTRRVPKSLAYAAGAVLEHLHRLRRAPGEPRMTRFVALQLATTHTYDLTPLERDTGYRELVEMAEATRRTIEWMRENHLTPGRP